MTEAERPSRPSADTSEASRRALRDLAVLLALPAMWVDLAPDDIAASVLDTLFGMFRLCSGYVRFSDPADGPALEHWRPAGPQIPRELEMMRTSAPTREHGTVTTVFAATDGKAGVCVTSMSSAFPNEEGIVIVGSAKADFPTDFELHLLRAAVGQAMISIHAARRLAAERAARVAAEATLQHRNALLARIADDLAAPLTLLADRAAQVLAAAAESSASPESNDVDNETRVGSATDDLRAGSGDALRSSVRLTRREAEVLGLLAQGLNNKEIAAVLWLSERTIERHITSLYRRIGVERRTEATAFALRHGFVDASLDEV